MFTGVSGVELQVLRWSPSHYQHGGNGSDGSNESSGSNGSNRSNGAARCPPGRQEELAMGRGVSLAVGQAVGLLSKQSHPPAVVSAWCIIHSGLLMPASLLIQTRGDQRVGSLCRPRSLFPPSGEVY